MSKVTERQYEEQMKEKSSKKDVLSTIEMNKAAILVFFILILFAVFMEQPAMMICIGIGVFILIVSYLTLINRLEKYIKERD